MPLIVAIVIFGGFNLKTGAVFPDDCATGFTGGLYLDTRSIKWLCAEFGIESWISTDNNLGEPVTVVGIPFSIGPVISIGKSTLRVGLGVEYYRWKWKRLDAEFNTARYVFGGMWIALSKSLSWIVWNKYSWNSLHEDNDVHTYSIAVGLAIND